jgi:hydrogenase maturation protease
MHATPPPDTGRGGHADTLVVGLGNEIARDDAVGILAARRLGRLLKRRSDVDVIELPWAGFFLLDALRGYRRAFLIDCLCSGRYSPGSVVRLSERDFAGSVRMNSFHDINYPTAMAFGRSLGWPLPDRVEIYAVEGESFEEFGTRLTPAVSEGLRKVVRLVAARLEAAAEPEAAIGQEVNDACGT